MKNSKKRLDLCVFEQNPSQSRQLAQNFIIQGRVSVNGKIVTKPGYPVYEGDSVQVELPKKLYASRGGVKLEQALAHFEISPENKVILDAGASNGGFTDCLLKKGAARVYAADVGKGQLELRLREDPRVCVMDGCNVRYLVPDSLPEKLDLITVDLYFISLEKVLPALSSLLKEEGMILALIKPQFEAGKGCTEKGVIKKRIVHIEVLEKVCTYASLAGLYPYKMTWSPIKGPSGNIEFFILCSKTPQDNFCDPAKTTEEAWSALGQEIK